MDQLNVLIVGAGPVGLTLACELARRDIDFRIIDRSSSPHQGSRAKGLQPRSLEILNDLGIAEQLLKIGTTELPYRKFAGSQLLGETARTGFPRPDTRFPKTLLLQQPAVETALRNRLRELGGKVEWNTEFINFTQTGEEIQCRLEHVELVEDIQCTYVVACDGGKSSIRKKLGIGFLGETHQQEQLWVGDVTVEGLKPDAWYSWLSPEYGLAFALFPFKDTDIWQLQAVMPPDEGGAKELPTLEGFNRLFKERTQMEGVTFTSSRWQSIYRVSVRRAEHYRVGNIFIAGDAAHVHSIAGGMGMNTGIQDAYNLGWKLAAVIKGQAGGQLLQTYGEERIPIADWLLEISAERQKVMMAGATGGKSGFEVIGTSDTTQLNLHYRANSLSALGHSTDTNLISGDRAPDVNLSDGSWLSTQLRGIEWKLLVFGEKSSDPVYHWIKPIYCNDANIIQAYGKKNGVFLIRPDGYIALIGDPSEASEYINRMTGKKS